MILTDTVHPPGGATALLASTGPPVVKLGWRYLPVVLLSSVIMEVWVLLWMNLGRVKYPHYWLQPAGHANVGIIKEYGCRHSVVDDGLSTVLKLLSKNTILY